MMVAFEELIEVFEVVDVGGKAKLGLGPPHNTNGVLISGAGLRAIEDHQSLFLNVRRVRQNKGITVVSDFYSTHPINHLRNKVSRIP